MKRFAYTAAALTLILGAVLPLAASAATGLTIQPVKVDQPMKAGDTLKGELLLTNASDSAVSVALSLQDFLPVAGADTLQFVGRAEGVTSVRDWISVDFPGTTTLAVGESRTIPYTVTAPADAEPGDHFGVILFKATPSNAPEGSLKVGTQVGTLVLITIPGNHLQKGSLTDFKTPFLSLGGPVPFTLTFNNTGTVHFEPRGEITVTNIFGKTAGQVPITGKVILPGGTKDLSFSWLVGPLAMGYYKAAATIYDGTGEKLTTATTSFWIVPIGYLIALIAVLFVIYVVLRFIKRHIRITRV